MKKKELVLIVFLFLAIAIVTAQNEPQTNNETENSSNTSISELPLVENESVTNNLTVDNSLTGAALTNVTRPLAKKVTLRDIAKEHKSKLNEKTKKYLELVDEADAGVYLVTFKKRIKTSKLSKMTVHREHGLFNTVKIGGNAGEIGELLEDSDIAYVELDQAIQVLGDSVPWGVERVGAPPVWNLTQGLGVKVAVLDTGIAPHDDLVIVGGNSTIGGDYIDRYGHGTAVAGVVTAALNDAGLVGVAPEAYLYAVKIMNSSTGDLSDAIEGVQWAIENNMSVVLMSFGMETYSQIFKEVLQEAADAGILLVAASGNTGENETLYPASYSSVIAVGAVDTNDDLTGFSSYGPDQELVAPGAVVNTTALNNGYAVSSGTSVAAAHVAGVAALLLGYNSNLTSEQVRAKLQNDALDLGVAGRDDRYGYGIVQVKLDMTNFTLRNDSYYYEVFNITNYDLEDETRVYWLNGTGTIDNISFQTGWYLIRKHVGGGIIDDVVHVDENGSVEVLNLIMGYSTSFTHDGNSSTAAIVWLNSALSFDPAPSGADDAYCLDENHDGVWEFCKYEPGDNADCSAFSSDLSGAARAYYQSCTNPGGVSCAEISNVGNLVSMTTSAIGQFELDMRWYEDCDDSSSARQDGREEGGYMVIDKKKSQCISSTQYKLLGRTAASTFTEYTTKSCITANQTCDYNVDEVENSTETADVNPCRTKESFPCSQTSQCLTGLACASGTCQNDTTDIQILNVIPIQVIPGVDMVKDKTGYVLVEVFNNGPKDATVLVNVTFDGSQLVIREGQSQSMLISQGNTVFFNFSFRPAVTGDNKTINANVTIIT